MQIGDKLLSTWLHKMKESRARFALLFFGSAVLALLAGWFVATQTGLLIENLRWDVDHGRAISYGVKIIIFGVLTMVLAALPIGFVVLWIRKHVFRK